MTDDRNDELHIVGGHLALDLVNTVAPRIPGSTEGHDHIATPAGLLAWSRRVAIVDEAGADAITTAWQGLPAWPTRLCGRRSRSAKRRTPCWPDGRPSYLQRRRAGASDPAMGSSDRAIRPGARRYRCGRGARGHLTGADDPGSVGDGRGRPAAYCQPQPVADLPGGRGWLRLAVPRSQPQRITPLVRDGRLRHSGQDPQAHRTSPIRYHHKLIHWSAACR